MKKIIVTGATGQDGSYMIEYLLENTQDTIIAAMRRTSQAILSNLEAVLGNPRVKLVTMDLNDAHSIESLIRDEKPDFFINLGAQTYVADSWISPAVHMQTNAVSLIHIYEAIRKHVKHCRVYSAGSSEQWGDVKYSPQDENHPMSPRSVYGVTKCAAALLTKVYRESYGLFAIHGILTNHESERRQNYFLTRKVTSGVARIYHAMRTGQSFEPMELGNVNASRDWSHALDFVDGIWKMLNQDKPREYVLSSGETHTVREFVEKAFAAADITYQTQWVGEGLNEQFITNQCWSVRHKEDGVFKTLVKINPAFYRPAEVELLWGDSSRARIELGWAPKIGFYELVRRMVENDIKLLT